MRFVVESTGGNPCGGREQGQDNKEKWRYSQNRRLAVVQEMKAVGDVDGNGDTIPIHTSPVRLQKDRRRRSRSSCSSSSWESTELVFFPEL